jgi:hypothetical protein
MRTKFLKMAICLVVLYALGYGVARWRKFIVMKECGAKEARLLIRRTGPGKDVREDWRGGVKNRFNPILFICFRPLCLIEDSARGFSKPLQRAQRAPNYRAALDDGNAFCYVSNVTGPAPVCAGR